ncbi:MAG TPA: sugar phosphate isomerase/epimerase family protein [Pirellulales bacterium]|nr:sugar phosphate isomerase/epimerase family protein [Pirellulales bacterium]
MAVPSDLTPQVSSLKSSAAKPLGRREFLGAGLAAAAAAMSGVRALAADAVPSAAAVPGKIKKSLKFGMVELPGTLSDKFRLLKEVGFDGVELDSPTGFDKAEVLAARDATGLVINGTVDAVHWTKPLSDPDPAVRAESLAALKTALRETREFGGTSVLLVPAVVNKEISYDDAYRRSQAEIRKAIPVAEETGVKIALENVWNSFLISPLEAARYIDEFNSPFVCAHFDIGNVLRYGWPEQWIRILGPRVFKLDVKEYSLKKMNDEGLWKGFDVPIGEGDCDWPAVMKALRDIKYSGWAAAEVPGGGRDRLADISQRLDRVLAA